MKVLITKFASKMNFKLAAIVTLALVTVSAKANAQDDFYTFFAEFQNSIKMSPAEGMDDYINSCYNRPDAYFPFNYYRWFSEKVKKEHQTLCQLSSKNKYSATKKQKGGDITWSIEKLSDEDAQEQYKIRSVYKLNYQRGSGDNGEFLFCVFAKIKNQYGESSWKIIDFSGIG